MKFITDNVEVIIAVIGLLLTGGGLIYAGRQLQESKRIARGDFLLRLDEILQSHQKVHMRLRGGDWANGGGPTSIEEWAEVEKYMGLFERIKVLIDDKIIDLATVNRLYGYRVHNIVANDIIRKAKLEDEAASWSDFIKLWKDLERHK